MRDFYKQVKMVPGGVSVLSTVGFSIFKAK